MSYAGFLLARSDTQGSQKPVYPRNSVENPKSAVSARVNLFLLCGVMGFMFFYLFCLFCFGATECSTKLVGINYLAPGPMPGYGV